MSRRKAVGTGDLFASDEPLSSNKASVDADAPLAERMRPRSLREMVGQSHLLDAQHFLAQAIAEGAPPSMILWGPPGSGKTTLARLLADTTKGRYVPFSAVLGGLPELRVIVADARKWRAEQHTRTLLFIDEIHRFNKGQQDAFLPHVEDGTITLIGATTENPSFSINAALLSRCKVFRLESLTPEEMQLLLERALSDEERGLGARGLHASSEALSLIARISQGDARRALVTLEATAQFAGSSGRKVIAPTDVAEAAGDATLLYDKSGEEHYNVVSAFIKSMRGSDPDAAIYWMMRMLEAGEDPLFVLRRMLIFASEDIGNADPRALSVTVAADEAFRRMGMPEGMYPLSHACLYLACAPKSNEVKHAWMSAQAAVKDRGYLPVPLKLRNAVTRLMKDEGYGKAYRYAHDFEGHVVPGETYLPDELVGSTFYEPSGEGLEKAIGERLARLRSTPTKE